MVNPIDKQPGEKKEGPGPEIEKSREEVIENIYTERREALREKEPLPEGETARLENLRQEVAEIEETRPEIVEQAQKEAGQIDRIDGKEAKLRRLLDVAEQQGVVYAVVVAQKMQNHFALDTLHDIFARDAFYRKFKK